MATHFSLHLLHKNAVSNVLLCMTSIDRLSYSLCSRKSKSTVVDLNVTASIHNLEFTDKFRITLALLPHYSDADDIWASISTRREDIHNDVWNLNVQQTFYIEPAERSRFIPWNHMGLSCIGWLAHCIEIFHIESIRRVTFTPPSDNFDFDQVQNILKKWDASLLIRCIMIDSNERLEVADKILSVPLQYKSMTVLVNSFGNLGNLRKAMLRNLERQVFFSENRDGGAALQIKLDDLLLTNASHLGLTTNLSDKDLNRFVKHWMRGTNRRLKKLIMCDYPNPKEYDATKVMKGIHYTNISQEDLREKMRTHNFSEFRDTVGDGFNIMSRDGREATIEFLDLLEIPYVRFFVWN